MTEEEREIVDLRLQIPRLTRSNWNTEFKEAFRDLALNYGEAGDIIITGRDIDIPRPDFNMRAYDVNENGNVVRDEDGDIVFMEARRYPNNEAGQRMFEKDEKRWMKLRENKKKLISKLFMLMDRDIRDKVMTSEGYEEAYAAYDILNLWNIVEQVVLGRGAISIYALTARLLSLKQTGEYSRFVREFKGAVTDLMRQGEPEYILEVITNTLFILALNQEQFKEKLTPIYGARQWPDFEHLSNELTAYVEATERMRKLRKDNDEGKVTAHATKGNARHGAGCWNCDSPSHIRADCTQPPSKCEHCGKKGHMAKYCLRKKEGKFSTHEDEQMLRRQKPKKKAIIIKSQERRMQSIQKETAGKHS